MKTSLLPVLPCLGSSFRRTSRALTQVYEAALKPLGLGLAQFTILQMLSLAGERTQGDLGRMLAMDSTSLTRTLAVMVRQGWIAQRRGDDRRERWLGLSAEGEVQLERALPVWEGVQAGLRGKLGEETWNGLLSLTRHVTAVAAELAAQQVTHDNTEHNAQPGGSK
jgi:DNA-binding MarR family transcriptional regulator